ncbi:hypothetical protein Dimus_022880, partial [Dionaea muscipula]
NPRHRSGSLHADEHHDSNNPRSYTSSSTAFPKQQQQKHDVFSLRDQQLHPEIEEVMAVLFFYHERLRFEFG